MDESVTRYLEEEDPDIADTVAAHIRPCILGNSGRCDEAKIPIGASKFCGRPDVPTGFEWPLTDDGPCWFLGQLNLAECDKLEPGLEIPESGLLSFFYHDAGGPAGTQSRMLHFPTDNLQRIEVVVDPRYGEDFQTRHLFARSLSLTQGFCVPDDFPTREELAECPELGDAISGFNDSFAYATHQFFGAPSHVWQTIPQKHQLIASFGECEDEVLYFIPEADVKTLASEQLRVLYECT